MKSYHKDYISYSVQPGITKCAQLNFAVSIYQVLGDCCKFAHSKADWGKLSFSVWDVAVLSTELQCHLNEMARSCLNRSPPQSMSQTWVASLLTLQRFPAVEAIQVSTFLQGVASFIASYLAIRIRAEILVMWFLRSFILNFMPST